jgi:hypothetical protein
MMTIDGSQHSGSGTIVRYSVDSSSFRENESRGVHARQKDMVRASSNDG